MVGAPVPYIVLGGGCQKKFECVQRRSDQCACARTSAFARDFMRPARHGIGAAEADLKAAQGALKDHAASTPGTKPASSTYVMRVDAGTRRALHLHAHTPTHTYNRPHTRAYKYIRFYT